MRQNLSATTAWLRLIAGAGFLCVVFLGWASIDRAAQDAQPDKKPADKKRVEEEDDTPAKPMPKRKIRIEEEDDPKVKPPRPSVNSSGDLGQLARLSKYGAVQQLFRKFAVPFDLIVPRDPSNVDRALPTIRTLPLERFYGSDRARLMGSVAYTELGADNKPGQEAEKEGMFIKAIQPYETLALEELERFRKGRDPYKDQPAVYERLLAEEQFLSAVLRFHSAAKESGKRKGNDWNGTEERLREELVKVMLQELAELTTSKEWETAFTLAMRMADSFPGESEQQAIAPKIFDLMRDALAANQLRLSLNDNHMREVYGRLRGLINRFPGNPQIQTLKRNLKEQAQQLCEQAKKKASSNRKEDLAAAQNLLRQSHEIWPTEEALQLLQDFRVKDSILRVGVHRALPKYLSPSTATTDNEKRGVELLFESLIRFNADSLGIGRYEPALAEGRPQVIDLGREFQLPSSVFWSNGQPLERSDITATFHALQEGRGPSNSLAWQSLFAEKPVAFGASNYRVRIQLSKGNLEPLSLMTQKIVPAFALKPEQEDTFGQNPIGSGPFVYNSAVHSENTRPCTVFVSNPFYGMRSSKLALPYLHEVRFFPYENAQKEVSKSSLANGQLSLLLDLTAQEAAQLHDNQAQSDWQVLLPNPKQINRRVYFLAINHRKKPLDDENVRAALSLAIDREKLLDTHYRGTFGKSLHKAINSPYPANCWACDPQLFSRSKNSCDPFDARLAIARLQQAEMAKVVNHGDLKLDLKYPAGDPILANALTDLAAQLQEVLKVKIEPKAIEEHQLAIDVERVFDYDLAYYYYDFPDDTFWLGPLFAPRANGNDENIFAYKSRFLPELLQKSIDYREFVMVQKTTRQIQRVLVQEVPVVPLWQLDPLHAIHKEVKAPPFDPQRVFNNIELWQLDRIAK